MFTDQSDNYRMRLLIVLLTLGLVGCTKGSDTPLQVEMRSGCNETSQASESFLEWGNESATTYTCQKVLSTMNCTLSQASDHSQAICETIDASNPPAAPNSACKSYGEGLHHFLDTDTFEAVFAYDCGQTYFPGLRCFLFSSMIVAGHSEMICLDNDL